MEHSRSIPHDPVRLSVITVAFNALSALRHTVESLQRQPLWPHLEYIIIDGGSTDGTLDYLRTLSSSIRWISEPDGGIYDAMNKGIGLATGNGLLFLNAGDRLVGDVLTSDLPVPGFLPVRYEHPVFGFGRMPLRPRNQGLPNCHQGIIFENRRDLFYDLQYRVCADYDFYLRHGYGDRLAMHACSGFVQYDNTGFSQQHARRRDEEIRQIIQTNFGIGPALRFDLQARLKRLIRPLIIRPGHQGHAAE